MLLEKNLYTDFMQNCDKVHLNNFENMGEVIKFHIYSKLGSIHLGNKKELLEKHVNRYTITHNENNTSTVNDVLSENEWVFDTSNDKYFNNLYTLILFIESELNKDIVVIGNSSILVDSSKCVYFNQSSIEEVLSDIEYIKHNFLHETTHVTILKLIQFLKGFDTYEEVFDYVVYNDNHVIKNFLNNNIFVELLDNLSNLSLDYIYLKDGNGASKVKIFENDSHDDLRIKFSHTNILNNNFMNYTYELILNKFDKHTLHLIDCEYTPVKDEFLLLPFSKTNYKEFNEHVYQTSLMFKNFIENIINCKLTFEYTTSLVYEDKDLNMDSLRLVNKLNEVEDSFLTIHYDELEKLGLMKGIKRISVTRLNAMGVEGIDFDKNKLTFTNNNTSVIKNLDKFESPSQVFNLLTDEYNVIMTTLSHLNNFDIPVYYNFESKQQTFDLN